MIEQMMAGNTEIVAKLLEKCSDLVNVRTPQNGIKIIKLLIADNCDMNDPNNKSSLNYAIAHWDQNLVSEFIEFGCNVSDPKISDSDNLIERKVDYNSIWDPSILNDYISHAIWHNKIDIVKLLVEKKSPLFYIENEEHGFTSDNSFIY